MSLRAEKRAFLIRVLGLERVLALEEDLPRAEKMLEEMGVAFKDDGAMDGRPLGGATSFGQADAFLKASQTAERTLDLVDVFRIVTSNVLAEDELKAADKPALLKTAATEFGKRLEGLGKKELEELTPRVVKALKATGSGAAAYVQDLVGSAGVKSADGEAAEAIQQLRAAGGPASGIVADLLAGGAVRG